MTATTSPSSLIDAIRSQNAGREAERLALKYAKMKGSAFVFLRGACHLFYEALPDVPALTEAPLAWCCGDMHFENFGSYKADNGLVYFDINDYDEAALAPCTWDIVRLLTSIRSGAGALNATDAEALAVSRDCLAAYRAALIRGKPLWVERDTASGLVRELLDALRERSRNEFLDRRTTRAAGLRHLKVDGVKALPADDAQRRKVVEFMDRFASERADPGFFKVLDIARRIAGTGSLGVMRYVILVEGKGSPDGNYLLDLKEAKASALQAPLARLGIAQPQWTEEAQRVVTVQKRLQAVDHAFLFAVDFDSLSCILKRLQPAEDRVTGGNWKKSAHQLEPLCELAASMGRILAWDQLRAAGHSGGANADELSTFARGEAWPQAILDAADFMTKETETQWKTFCQAKL